MLLGIHTNISGIFGDDKNIESAIVRDSETFGINACQIFVMSPHAYSCSSKINTSAVAKVCKQTEISVHSAYTTVGIWKVYDDNVKTPDSKKKLGFFEYQMKLTKELTGSCLVVHLTKIYPDEVAETMNILKKIAKKHKVRIGLEMTAVKSDSTRTYETPEKLDNLIKLLGPTKNYYGIVVDTAHLWGAGEDIASYDNMKNWLDRLTFKKKIILFHLNGSYSEKGSGKDKHAIPFNHDDLIFSKFKPENSGVRAVIEFAKKYKVPVILEINRGTTEEAKKTLEIIKKM
jgi:endonuclease IV